MFYLLISICFMASLLLTPLVKYLALKFDITDKPDQRRINVKPIPSIGGLAIYSSFMIGLFLLPIEDRFVWTLAISGTVMMLTGLVDDLFDIKARYKLFGQILAAFVIVFFGDINIDFINLPFGGEIHFGILSIPLTILWIVTITNAINLIDGLDGLAAGVSTIALFTILGMAFIMSDSVVILVATVLISATLGFLPYNFNPAKIFMGDTGALFLGFIIAVLSVMGFKNVTFISLIVPILILGVPLSDTIFAIIRRMVTKQPIAMADKYHLHHCLMNLGFTHRQTVILIYAIAALFSLFSFIFTMSTLLGSIILMIVLVILIEVLIETLGLIGKNYRPIMRLFKMNSENEEEKNS
nr:MraY family glycosyltransferase [Listeria sp. PSOL-1]